MIYNYYYINIFSGADSLLSLGLMVLGYILGLFILKLIIDIFDRL